MSKFLRHQNKNCIPEMTNHESFLFQSVICSTLFMKTNSKNNILSLKHKNANVDRLYFLISCLLSSVTSKLYNPYLNYDNYKSKSVILNNTDFVTKM